MDVARDSCERLAELALRFDMPLHLEAFGPSPFLNARFLVSVLQDYPMLRYCFDVAHLHLAAKRDGFDYYELAQALGPFLGSIHLWNARHMEDYRAYRHIPVHPSQSPEEGWVDIPRILKVLLGANPQVPIILEYAPRYPSPLGKYDYREGVEWVRELITSS